MSGMPKHLRMSAARLTSRLSVQAKTRFRFGGARRLIQAETSARNQRSEPVPPPAQWRWLAAQRNKRQQEGGGTFLGRWLVPVLLIVSLLDGRAADSKKSDVSDAYF